MSILNGNATSYAQRVNGAAGEGDYARILRAPTLDDLDINVQVVPRDRIVEEGSSDFDDVLDSRYAEETGATVAREADALAASVVGNVGGDAGGVGEGGGGASIGTTPDVAFLSGNEAVATVSNGNDGEAHLTALDDGTVPIYVGAVGRSVGKKIAVEVEIEEAATARTFSEFVVADPPWLAREMADAIDTRIDGKTPAVAWPLFSTRNHTSGANGTYVWNTDCWAVDIDWSCVSVAHQLDPAAGSGWSNVRGGTLIAPDLMILANHYTPPVLVGSQFRFVTPAGAVRTATVHSSTRVGTSDVRLVRFTAPVGDGIEPAKILPIDWPDYLPSNTEHETYAFFNRLPIVGINQDKEALVFELLHTALPETGTFCFHSSPHAPRNTWSKSLITGDSGHGMFAIIGGEPVMLFHHLSANNGPWLANMAEAINTAADGLGSENTLTEVDLSGFETTAEE